MENLLIEKRSEGGRRGIFLLNKKDTCNVIIILKKKNRILKIFSFEIQDFQITGEKCIRNFYNRANHSYESSSVIGFFINSFLLPCCDTSIVKNTRSKKNQNYELILISIVFFSDYSKDFSKTMVSTVSIAMNPVRNSHFEEQP